MHPGPVNRGVSSRPRFDSPQPDRAAGRDRHRGAHGGALRPPRGPQRTASAGRPVHPGPASHGRLRPLLCRRRARQPGAPRSAAAGPRAGLDARARPAGPRRGRSPARRSRHARARAVRGGGRRRKPPAPGLRRPARPPADAGPRADRGPRLRHPLGRRGRLQAILAMPNTDPAVDCRRPRIPERRGLRDAACRSASTRRSRAGSRATRSPSRPSWPDGALGFSDDGRPCTSAAIMRRALQYQRLCRGLLALHEEYPSLSGGGVCTRARAPPPRPGRDAVHRGVPRWSPATRRWPTTRTAHPHPPPLRARVRRGHPPSQGARRADHGGGQPHHLALTDAALPWRSTRG